MKKNPNPPKTLKHPYTRYVMVGFSEGEITIKANFGHDLKEEPFEFNYDDLLVEEETRLNPGTKEPWRFKGKVGYEAKLEICNSKISLLSCDLRFTPSIWRRAVKSSTCYNCFWKMVQVILQQIFDVIISLNVGYSYLQQS